MDEKPKAKMGRPTKYCPEIVDRICLLVATHTCGLKKLCIMYPEIPDDTTIQDWRYLYTDFSLRYAQSKMKQAELLAEEVLDICDYDAQDTTIDSHGNEVCNVEYIARSRLRVDTRKWIATKLAPKIYGERQQVDTTVTIKHEDALKDLA